MQGKLYSLRKDRKLTQEDLARYLNINVHTYRNKELGYTAFNANEMFKIGKLFNSSIDNIFLPQNVPIRNDNNWIKAKEE